MQRNRIIVVGGFARECVYGVMSRRQSREKRKTIFSFNSESWPLFLLITVEAANVHALAKMLSLSLCYIKIKKNKC